MRTAETSHPFDCASARHTPAICRPARGRTRGRLAYGACMGIAAPHAEQKRALKGNPVPHFAQNTAISLVSLKARYVITPGSVPARGFRPPFLGAPFPPGLGSP